jgi:hypothetical protein
MNLETQGKCRGRHAGRLQCRWQRLRSRLDLGSSMEWEVVSGCRGRRGRHQGVHAPVGLG